MNFKIENKSDQDVVFFNAFNESDHVGHQKIEDFGYHKDISYSISLSKLIKGDIIEVIDFSDKPLRINEYVKLGNKKHFGEFFLIGLFNEKKIIVPERIFNKKNIPDQWISEIHELLSKI